MNRQNCVSTIYKECVDPEGFLVKLRGGQFSQSQYEVLLKALVEFREFIRGQEYIERKVVYCLYYLDVEFLGALKSNFWVDHGARVIQKAQRDMSAVITEIFTLESPITKGSSGR